MSAAAKQDTVYADLQDFKTPASAGGRARGSESLPPPTIYSDIASIVHKHERCRDCQSLLEADRRPLSRPLLTVECAVVRRVRNARAFDPSDFEVALTTRAQPTGALGVAFPSSFLLIGEAPTAAAIRCTREKTWLKGRKAITLSLHANPLRDVRQHAAALLHVVVANPADQPANVHGHDARYYNLRDAVENKAKYAFILDHRELLYNVVGWLRLRFEIGVVDQIFATGVRSATTVVHNPFFDTAVKSTLDEPLVSYTNPYFATGQLKPAAQVRPALKKIDTPLDVVEDAVVATNRRPKPKAAAVPSLDSDDDLSPPERGTARRAARKESSSSLVISDSEHPFNDDLASDFTNPLHRARH